MDTLCIDIGGGTEDISYYTKGELFENCPKMVLHTPSKRLCTKIEHSVGDLFIGGGVIGGGSLAKTISAKIKTGSKIYMARQAALTIKDNPDYVKKLGVVLVEDVINPNIIFDEFDIEIISHAIKRTLQRWNPQTVAVAAQDHGYIKGQSDRVTRFSFLKEFLKNGLRNAFYTNIESIPVNFSRWRTLAASIKAKCPDSLIHISDTAVVASIGAASTIKTRPIITVDVGNCHTFAALIGEDDKVYAFFEHHTHVLTPEKMTLLVEKLTDCTIDGKEIFENEGHGAYVFEKINATGCPVLITGPHRERFFTPSSNIIFSYPKGDTMMAGPVGLLIQTGTLI